MELALLPDRAAASAPAPNGGFPEPPATGAVRVVAARHPACGAETEVRVSAMLPPGVVRRVRCAGCDSYFSTDDVVELGIERPRVQRLTVAPDEPVRLEGFLVGHSGPTAPVRAAVEPATPAPEPIAPAAAATAAEARLTLLDRLLILMPDVSLPRPSLPAVSLPDLRLPDRHLPKLRLPDLGLPSLDPDSRAWRLASIPLAAVAVIVGLMLIQGGGDEPQTAAERSATAGLPAAGGSGGGAKVSEDATLVRGSSYSLALPGGWEQIQPEGGATFAAVSADGGADATLWIERDPNLDFPTFVARSVEQLRGLAGSARVVERVPAPTIEATVVRLAADAPEGQPSYEVTLRAVGPYRYYLATSVQPDAAADAVEGAELVAGSFTPDLGDQG